MSTDKALQYFAANRNPYLDDVKELVRIPSVSFAGFDPQQVRNSAEAPPGSEGAPLAREVAHSSLR